LHALGERERIPAYLREAEILAAALDDRRRLGRVSTFMGQWFVLTGNADRALEPLQRALAIAEDCADFSLQVMPRFLLGGGAYYHLGDYRRAIDCLRWGVESIAGKQLCERFGLNGLPSVQFRSFLSRCLAELGAFAEGITYGEEAVRIAKAADHPYSRLWAYWGVGFLYLRKGEPYTAISTLERGLRLFSQVETSPVLSNELISHLGYAYALSGRVTEAVPLLTQAIEQFAAMGQMLLQAMRVAWLSEAQLLAGHIDKAVPLAQRALELSHEYKERGEQAWILRLLGEIATQCDPPQVEQADDYYQQALTLAEELGMRPLQAHCYHSLGTLYARIGRREQGRTALTTAIELYRAMDMTFWLPQAEATLAQTGWAEEPEGGIP
jgi:tetratricopeptide (TPR) repeat protein